MSSTTSPPAEQFGTRLIADINQHIDELAANGTTLDQYVQLTLLKRRLDAATKRVKTELEPRMDELLDYYSERGSSGERHAGTGKAVSINRTLRAAVAKGVEKPAAAAALKAHGFEEFVEEGFNLSTLSAYFRDQERQYIAEHGVAPAPEALIPDELKAVLSIYPDIKLGVAS